MYKEVGTIKPKWGVGVRWGQHSQLFIIGLEIGFFFIKPNMYDDVVPGTGF
jgi:hypothetical protein